MSNPEVRLIGALDDMRGRATAVYQDHDGVRVDVGPIEIMYDVAGARRLIDLLTDAIHGANGYAIDHAEYEAAEQEAERMRGVMGDEWADGMYG